MTVMIIPFYAALLASIFFCFGKSNIFCMDTAFFWGCETGLDIMVCFCLKIRPHRRSHFAFRLHGLEGEGGCLVRVMRRWLFLGRADAERYDIPILMHFAVFNASALRILLEQITSHMIPALTHTYSPFPLYLYA